ncbi:uncharacterized protein LOC126903059 isoform X2 [Daktulosphaira vitifoliae]|nr:uncharacterized protein LOC126903059 isoform X2 [Daktulosphaira vitifoliae]
MFSALTYMKITQGLLKGNEEHLLRIIVHICKYNQIVKKQISTLYDRAKEKIGSLWLVYIYSSSLIIFLPKFNDGQKMTKNDDRFKYIDKALDYVIQMLQQDVINCDKSNEFNVDITNLNFKKITNIKSINLLLLKNSKTINKFIEIHNSPELILPERFERISKTKLFMRNAVTNQQGLQFLENEYNVQVNWSINMNKDILVMFKRANSLDWSDGNFKSIKNYYVLFFNFFKVIMLRLTWKHFLYLQHQNINVVEYLAKEWLLILNNFSQLTCVENDSDIVKITSNINEFISYIPKNKNGSVDEDEFPNYKQQHYFKLESELKIILTDICIPLKCYAIAPIFLFGQEHPERANKPAHNPEKLETVDYYSLFNTRMFLKQINTLSEYTDYNLVRSFINYIDTCPEIEANIID